MKKPIKNSEPNEIPILSVIQDIKDKKRDPKMLSKEERQECVAALLLEGYTASQIAQVLSRSEKTIKRDLEELRDKNSLSPNIELTKKLIGDMMMKSSMHHAYLMRLARKPDGTISEKAQSEFMAWRIVRESTELLQSLGYLPLRPKEIVGDIFHHQESGSESLSELRSQIEEIETLASECGEISDDAKSQLANFKEELKRMQMTEDLKKIEASAKENTHESENKSQ